MLSVDIFGHVSACDDAAGTALPLPRAARELLGCLVLHAVDRPLRRESLAEKLWPDCAPGPSRQRLRSALWRLRRGLGPVLRGALRQSSDQVRCDPASLAPLPHTRFAETIEACCALPVETMTADDFRRLDAALELYVGPVMDGFDGAWLPPIRERYADLYCRGLEHQIIWYRAHGNPAGTIRAGRNLLQADPYREDVHAMLIGLYAAAGQPRRAVRQFNDCRDAIEKDLGVAPSRARAALCDALQRPPRPAARDVGDVLRGLQESVGALERQLRDLRAVLTEDRER